MYCVAPDNDPEFRVPVCIPSHSFIIHNNIASTSFLSFSGFILLSFPFLTPYPVISFRNSTPAQTELIPYAYLRLVRRSASSHYDFLYEFSMML